MKGSMLVDIHHPNEVFNLIRLHYWYSIQQPRVHFVVAGDVGGYWKPHACQFLQTREPPVLYSGPLPIDSGKGPNGPDKERVWILY